MILAPIALLAINYVDVHSEGKMKISRENVLLNIKDLNLTHENMTLVLDQTGAVKKTRKIY